MSSVQQTELGLNLSTLRTHKGELLGAPFVA